MLKALIVDDNASYRQSLRKLLCTCFPNMAVTEAADANQALEEVAAARPHLVFVDINLPGEDGLELTKKIRTDQGDTIIAILTNYDLPEYREAADQCGANCFFSKSTSPIEEILEMVESTSSELNIDLHGTKDDCKGLWNGSE